MTLTPKTIYRSVRTMFARNLALLCVGQTISMAGDSVYTKALIWLLLDMTGSSGTTGLVAVSAYLPTLLTGVWAGAVVDRSDHRRVMIAADGVRALLVLLVPILFAAGALTPSLLFCITFLVATGATFFNPARDALIPSLVSERTHLLRANALIQSSWMFALLLGPAVAMALLSLLGAHTQHLFIFGAAAYLISLVCIVALRTPRKTQDSAQGPSTLHRDLAEGIRYAFRNRVVRGLLLITAADNLFIMGPAGVGMAVFVREVLKRDIGSLMAIEVCYAIGMIVGTALLPLWNRRLGYGKILIAGMVLDGVTFVPLLWVRHVVGNNGDDCDSQPCDPAARRSAARTRTTHRAGASSGKGVQYDRCYCGRIHCRFHRADGSGNGMDTHAAVVRVHRGGSRVVWCLGIHHERPSGSRSGEQGPRLTIRLRIPPELSPRIFN